MKQEASLESFKTFKSLAQNLGKQMSKVNITDKMSSISIVDDAVNTLIENVFQFKMKQ